MSTWSELHSQSQDLAMQAEGASRRGETDRARLLYADAAQLEAKALNSIERSKQRTFEASLISTVWLYIKGGKLNEAKQLCEKFVADAKLTEEARRQLAQAYRDCGVTSGKLSAAPAVTGHHAVPA